MDNIWWRHTAITQAILPNIWNIIWRHYVIVIIMRYAGMMVVCLLQLCEKRLINYGVQLITSRYMIKQIVVISHEMQYQTLHILLISNLITGIMVCVVSYSLRIHMQNVFHIKMIGFTKGPPGNALVDFIEHQSRMIQCQFTLSPESLMLSYMPSSTCKTCLDVLKYVISIAKI